MYVSKFVSLPMYVGLTTWVEFNYLNPNKYV